MASGAWKIHVPNRASAVELADLLSGEGSVVAGDTRPAAGDNRGMTGPAVVITWLSPGVIGIVGAWLLERRRGSSCTYHLEREKQDGAVTGVMITVQQPVSPKTAAQVIDELAAFSGVPAQDIRKAIAAEAQRQEIEFILAI